MHGAGGSHPAEIITSEVYQHDVLGRFFRIGQQCFFIGDIFFAGLTARQCAGDGPERRRAAIQFDERFR